MAIDRTSILPVASPAATFGLYGKPWFLIALSLSLTAVFVVFAVFPNLDIAISRLFYSAGTCGNEALCGGFPLAESLSFATLRSVFYAMPFVVFIATLIIHTAVFMRQKISFWRDAKVVGAIVSCLIIGPGFLVNGVLKEFILRSRPRDVLPFGGDLPFVPVGQLSGLCAGNCSFVSGEASIAPIMVLSVLLLPKHWQKAALLVLLPCSFAMALLRVAVGAHYISDVVLGYGLTLLIFSVFAVLLQRGAKI